MNLDLLNMDLSLFDRDALVGPVPTSAELNLKQDVYQSPENIVSAWDTDFTQLADSLPLDNNVVDDAAQSWIDSSVDLLDLLTQENEVPQHAQMMSITAAPACEEKQLSAVEILESVALETAQMLSNPPSPASSQASFVDTAQAVEPTVDMNLAFTGPSIADEPSADFLNLLNSSMDCNVDLDSVLQPMNLDLNILSPVSADDVTSVLSSEPPSPTPQDSWIQLESLNKLQPAHFLPPSLDVVDQGMQMLSSMQQPDPVASDLSDIDSGFTSDDSMQSQSQVNTVRGSPYERPSGSGRRSKLTPEEKEARDRERKARKKAQNKQAALRYRQRQRTNKSGHQTECQELESRNSELKDQVEQMTNEIGYLKNLLAEVFKTRGITLPNILQVK